MTLDELLQQALNLPVKKRKRLLQSKQVTCDGKIVTDRMLTIDSGLFDIRVKGKRIGENLGHTYIALNKPKGVLSAKKDLEFTTVLELLKEQDFDESLSIVGRLDRDSTGLVFLTNNGQLHYLFEQARFAKEKQYHVTVNGKMDQKMVEAFEKGLLLEGGIQLKPAELRILNQSMSESTGVVTLTEGKRHQIKRMFLQCGVKVIGLHRIMIGPIYLDKTTQSGQYRHLYKEELQEVKEMMQELKRS
ncbi:MAG: pseudouridine synthase [Ruoffia tabacinasalis]|uniref:pseudouridine synthase n=1 Tax=unclassified Ruoffia TaxID=2862149 RepID=UPI000EDF0DF1|nr:rRNA pseudouridine synthase [Aerococcaceae bacterium]